MNVLRLHLRHKSLTSSAKQPTPIQLCRTLRTRWDNRKQSQLGSCLFQVTFSLPLWSATFFRHSLYTLSWWWWWWWSSTWTHSWILFRHIVPRYFQCHLHSFTVSQIFLFTRVLKKVARRVWAFKPWHTIDDETVMKLAPPQCQSFSIKSCLVFVNGLVASDIAVLKFSTEYLVQGGGFSWPFCSILHTSSSIPTRKASGNHRGER